MLHATTKQPLIIIKHLSVYRLHTHTHTHTKTRFFAALLIFCVDSGRRYEGKRDREILDLPHTHTHTLTTNQQQVTCGDGSRRRVYDCGATSDNNLVE